MRKTTTVFGGITAYSLACDACGGGSKPVFCEPAASELAHRNAEELSVFRPVAETGWSVERHPHPERYAPVTAHLCFDCRTPRGTPVAADDTHFARRAGRPCNCLGCVATRAQPEAGETVSAYAE